MRARLTAILVAVLAIAGAEPAWAQRQPVDLALWGGFGAGAARCQRVLSRATTRCIAHIVGTRAACFDPVLDGGTCNGSALAAAVSAAQLDARRRIEGACVDADLHALGYPDVHEALADVEDVCARVETAATSAAFGPALVGGSVASVAPGIGACLRAGAEQGARVLRVGLRAYQKVLDRIATLTLAAEEKDRLIAWAERRIASARASLAARLGGSCTGAAFESAYGRSIEAHLATVAAQARCMAETVYAQTTVTCPAPLCGNGAHELPAEQCDDGDDSDSDGCRSDCTACVAAANSYELIQHAIFERRDCTMGACHGVIQSGGVDLRAEVSYDQQVGIPSSIDPNRQRIEPGHPERSVLFLKLAAKTLPEQYPADELGIGSPMPLGAVPGLTEAELEAVRLWILASAPRTETVAGVTERLNGCPQGLESP